MFRTHYKPRTHHRDGYGPSATVAQLTRCNGFDLYDVDTAAQSKPADGPAPRVIADRYTLMSDPSARAALRAFRARTRAARRVEAVA